MKKQRDFERHGALARIVQKAKIFFILFMLIGLVLPSGANAQPKTRHEITVSAAISLKNAFEDIGKTFKEKNPGVEFVFNFGGSGDLARQIEAGAPVDVFEIGRAHV